MIVVIIAGGSGSRLWPLSTPDYPKHLLKVTGDQSLLQSTYARAGKLTSQDKIYIITDGSHAHHVRDQLAGLDAEHCIVEPGRRSTASCVVAALYYMQSRHDHDEPIVFLSADHFIRDVDGFARSFRTAAAASQKYGREVLVGIEPTYPSTGLGYIQKGELIEDASLIFNVECFVEKPELAKAKAYVRSGNFLWNGGYFVGSVNTFLKAMLAHSPLMQQEYDRLLVTTNEEEYRQAYLGFESVSIDYALNEHVPDLLVVPAGFDWMDIGSFNDMYGVMDDYDEHNNHVRGPQIELEDVDSSFVHNQEDKPVAVIGLDNVVVINTPHGLLVTRKDLSQKVGDVSKRFKKD
jgi:mannose-1-phosphate guanylyltransferase